MRSVGFTPSGSSDLELEKLRKDWKSLNDLMRDDERRNLPEESRPKNVGRSL